MKYVIFLVAFLPCISVSAAEVSSCKKSGVGLVDIPSPFKKNVRTFSNKKINIVLMDRTEPVNCSFYVAFIIDDRKSVPAGGRRCFSLGCFGNVDFQTIKSSYETTKGLLLRIPVQFYNDIGNIGKRKIVKVRINLYKVSVRVEK